MHGDSLALITQRLDLAFTLSILTGQEAETALLESSELGMSNIQPPSSQHIVRDHQEQAPARQQVQQQVSRAASHEVPPVAGAAGSAGRQGTPADSLGLSEGAAGAQIDGRTVCW